MKFINFQNRRVRVCADLHFNHNNIIKYCNRPFLTKEEAEILKNNKYSRPTDRATREMDEVLISNINKNVDPDNDVLIIVGDFCFAHRNQNYYEVAKYYRDRIIYKEIHFLWGNHDEDNDYNNFLKLFTSTHDILEISCYGKRAILAHYALAVWPGCHKSMWSFYGHSHSSAEKWLDIAMPGRLSFDIGVDNAAKLLGEYRPFDFKDDIIPRLSRKPPAKVHSHSES